MSEENQGFTISDKRIRTDSTLSGNSDSAEAPKPSESHDTGKPRPDQIPPDFSGFILSLGTSALVHMGENVLPDHKNSEPNFPQAKEIIDLLSLLEEKTKGNLTKEENNLLSNLLYTLRMKFVEIKNK
ncbi:MAG: DUF1844 domain-containing protein [Nitrospirae bacterium]|nr:DUF1844 domain-containing protein [Nitrospirota bacterium]